MMAKIKVKGSEITLYTQQEEDYICITDIARHKNQERTDDLIRNWIRNRNTVELFCNAFVIMPNHIHAILRIEKPEPTDDGGDGRDARGRDARPCVSTTNKSPQITPHGIALRSPPIDFIIRGGV